MSDRPTPETDGAERMAFAQEYMVPTDFARKIERERDEALSDLEFRRGLYKVLEEANNRLIAANQEAVALVRTLKQERDEAREELSSIHRWVERHNQDGFDDKLTHRQNVDICYDLLYDRLDMAELELNRIKRAVIATLDENRHLADGMDCTLIKLRAVVPTWK